MEFVTLQVTPSCRERFVFDVSDAVCFVESASSVVAVFCYAHVAAPYAAFAQEAISVPVPEVKWVSLADDAGIEGRVNVDFEFASVCLLQVINLVESGFIFFWSRSQVGHVSAGASYGHKIVVDYHACAMLSCECRWVLHVPYVVLGHCCNYTI